MESTITTTPQSMNYSTLHNKVIMCVSSACDVPVSEMMSATKRRDAANAKSIFCVIMHEKGYSKNDIARYLGADHKSVYYYINAHLEKMKEESYSNCYDKSLVLLDNYAKDITDYDHAINDLRKMVMELQSKYEHIKQLLLN